MNLPIERKIYIFNTCDTHPASCGYPNRWVLETSPITWNSTNSEKYTTTLTPFKDKNLIWIDGDVPEETECDEISKVKENV